MSSDHVYCNEELYQDNICRQDKLSVGFGWFFTFLSGLLTFFVEVHNIRIFSSLTQVNKSSKKRSDESVRLMMMSFFFIPSSERRSCIKW